jgi:hypothetical protein
MCATVNKYESKVRKLQYIIYPEINEAIEETLCFINVYNYEGLEENLNKLSEEFLSLIHIENNLVFPVVLSVFKADFDYAFFPNTQEIIQLTACKETKVNHYLYNIKQIVAIDENNLKDDFEVQLKKLFNLFDLSYLPAKKRWNSMLQMLSPKAVQCNNRSNDGCKCGNNKEHDNKAQHQH